MTRDDLYKQIDDWKPVLFIDIPEDLQDAETAYRWIAKGIGTLINVPKHLIDDNLRLAAVSREITGGLRGERTISFKSINFSDTDRYEEFALIAITDDYLNILNVDVALMSNEFMMKALAANAHSLYPLLGHPNILEQRKITITQEMIDFAVANSTAYFRTMPFREDQYRVEAVRKCIKNHYFDLNLLHKIGHFSTLVNVIKDGYWPGHFSEQPVDLVDAFEKIELLPTNQVVYRAYVMSHPIEEVIACIDTREQKIELLNMYSHSDLMPFLKGSHLAKDQELKGLLLENVLGV
jgi:hypothetical protein